MNVDRETNRRPAASSLSRTILLYLLPLILWMGVIFYSSAQPFSKQDLKPWLERKLPDRSVERLFGDVKVHYAKSEISVRALGEERFVQFWIRKGAHVFVYLVLGLLAIRLWHRVRYRVSWAGVLAAFSFSALYAVTDELHQYYTGERSPMVQDVVLDSVGALVGIILYLLLAKIRNVSYH